MATRPRTTRIEGEQYVSLSGLITWYEQHLAQTSDQEERARIRSVIADLCTFR